MFPIASPTPMPQTMTSQNFPLHALVLLLIALTERTNSWNARLDQPVKTFKTKESFYYDIRRQCHQHFKRAFFANILLPKSHKADL